MDKARCEEAKARLGEALSHLATNNQIFAETSALLAVAIAARTPMSMPDLAELEQRISALEGELANRRGDFMGGEEQLQNMRKALAQAKKDAERIGELDAQIEGFNAKIRDTQHQIGVQTERAGSAQTDIDLYCS